jgi:PIN domain nuclease of toxin-antitoxin system
VSAARKVVLDASALLAWVLRERGSDTIDKLLPIAVIPAPNLVEVLYRAVERGHRMPLADLHASIVGIGVEIAPLTEADADRAAELIRGSRAQRKTPDDPCLSLGDGLCLAVAERLNLTVTGGDQHWATWDLSIAFMPFR